MADITILARSEACVRWFSALESEGLCPTCFADVLQFQEQFAQSKLDILIVDIENADDGAALAMSQARAKWQDCRIVAVTPNRGFQRSAVYRMGLWCPDQVLVRPFEDRILPAVVSYLLTTPQTGRAPERTSDAVARPVRGGGSFPMRLPGGGGEAAGRFIH